MFERKFDIGDRVYVAADNRAWFVIGVQMRPSYDLICWQYWLGRALYGDYPIGCFGNRCDVETRGPAQEDGLESESDRLVSLKQELDLQIQQTEKRLEELKKEAADR